MRISISMLFEFICMVNARFALLQFANYRVRVRAADSVVICELSKNSQPITGRFATAFANYPFANSQFADYPSPPYFGYIHLHSCKHKTVTLKLTLTLTLTLTDTRGAVLYRLGSGLRNTVGGELQQERPGRNVG